MWEEARIVLHGLGTAQASAHRIVESPIKSIRVLKGMQQCEDFAPPPEPSGQRKQMAALCMLLGQNTRGDYGGLQQVSRDKM